MTPRVAVPRTRSLSRATRRRSPTRRRSTAAAGSADRQPTSPEPIWLALAYEVYRAALPMAVPAAWFMAPGLDSLGWIPAVLGVALLPLLALQRQRRDAVALGLVVLAAAGSFLLPLGPALWVGGIGTLLAFAIATPFLGFVITSLEATLT